MKIVFAGTSEFAVPILRAMRFKTDWEIVLVVSEPAKPAGRKNQPADFPVALTAKELNLNLLTPASVNDIAGEIKNLNPDVLVIVAYGQILPLGIINIPKFKTVNVHPSLLPKLRGPSPIQGALKRGHKKTGVSLMVIDEKVDHGPVISQQVVAIDESDTYLTLEPKLANLGAKMIIRDLPKYISGEFKPKPQDDSQTTLTRMIKKENGRINWQKKSAEEVLNLWRAYLKWPGVFTFFKNKSGEMIRLKLIEVGLQSMSGHEPGEVFTDKSKTLYIACRESAVKITKLQPENSKILTPQEFLNGYNYVVGQVLG